MLWERKLRALWAQLLQISCSPSLMISGRVISIRYFGRSIPSAVFMSVENLLFASKLSNSVDFTKLAAFGPPCPAENFSIVAIRKLQDLHFWALLAYPNSWWQCRCSATLFKYCSSLELFFCVICCHNIATRTDWIWSQTWIAVSLWYVVLERLW